MNFTNLSLHLCIDDTRPYRDAGYIGLLCPERQGEVIERRLRSTVCAPSCVGVYRCS